jgi:hypothetical protein
MGHTKQRLTQLCIVVSLATIFVTYLIRPRWSLYAFLILAILWTAYRLSMFYKRRCTHCGSWKVRRRHVVDPPLSAFSCTYVCTTYRSCRNPLCIHVGREEEEPSYTKQFGLVHTWVMKHVRGIKSVL